MTKKETIETFLEESNKIRMLNRNEYLVESEVAGVGLIIHTLRMPWVEGPLGVC